MKQRKRGGGDGEIMIDRDVDETFRPNENEGEIMIARDVDETFPPSENETKKTGGEGRARRGLGSFARD